MALAQLAVFVRPPETGEVKTRLVRLLGDRGAAALYRAFVEDTLSLCERIRAAGRVDVALWTTSVQSDDVANWASRLQTTALLQPEGDLGVRLSHAFDHGLRSHQRVVIVGSDAPTLPIELIAMAFESLDDASITIGPASDGGYYAIGASQRVRPRFDAVRWSTEHAFEDTLRANAAHTPAIIPPWYDIDEPEDLQVLLAHLSVAPAAAPATANCLAGLEVAQR